MKLCTINRIGNASKSVYLTFDDGPEPGITEFVLNELDRCGFKATFFCTGQNAENCPELMDEIHRKGHSIGNHSYQHKHAYELDYASYVKDIEKADGVLHTELFRPPNGCLRLSAWLRLRKKYKIIYWSVISGDWRKKSYDVEECKSTLRMTNPGDIILFHFSNEFGTATRELLPWYLKWLSKNGYKSAALS